MLISAPNEWIGELFPPENIDAAVATLVGPQRNDGRPPDIEAARARRAGADQQVRRFQAAITAGVHHCRWVDALNQAQAEPTAAQAEIDAAQTSEAALDLAELYAMIDSLGDVGAVLGEAKPASLQRLYQALNVEIQYEPEEKAAYVTATPRADSACVRGARRAHSPHAEHAGEPLSLRRPLRTRVS
jgi:hypothetical protein